METLYNTRMPAAPLPTVRVAHSILHAADLAALCSQAYGLDQALTARLISHGQNDWYALQAGAGRWALRVLKTGSRSSEQLSAELAWQRALAASCNVIRPCAARDGQQIACVNAPEGMRWLCLYEWLDGATLGPGLDVTDAQEAGRQLAQLHGHPAQLPPDSRRHDLRDKLARTAPALDAATMTGASQKLVAAARIRVVPWLTACDTLPQGSLHGDLHFGNLRRGTDGRLWILDFDDCGLGALVVDLTAFSWRTSCESLPAEINEAFLRGYQSVRPLSKPETDALPALRVARALYLAGVYARDRDFLGQVPGFDRPWEHYLDLVRDALDQLQS